jgi:hypothetical protein
MPEVFGVHHRPAVVRIRGSLMSETDALLDVILRELTQLRRGHGLHSVDVLTRVGPNLRQLIGITEQLPAGEARQVLTDRLAAMVAGLPPDLALAVQAAFGLPPASQARFLRERMQWLAVQIHRDPRTASRRVDSGLALLAERIVSGTGGEVAPSGSEFAPDGWYVELLRANYMLVTDPVQLLENRRIVSTRPGLERITVSWSVPFVASPTPRPDLEPEIHFGGRLVKNEQLSTPIYWSGDLLLPRPLDVGQSHEYQVQVRTLPRHEMLPYYVLSPVRRVDEFDVRVKFDPARSPQRVWALNGLPYRIIDERRPTGEPLEPDAVGEVVRRFSNLRPGLSYGVQWLF